MRRSLLGSTSGPRQSSVGQSNGTGEGAFEEKGKDGTPKAEYNDAAEVGENPQLEYICRWQAKRKKRGAIDQREAQKNRKSTNKVSKVRDERRNKVSQES